MVASIQKIIEGIFKISWAVYNNCHVTDSVVLPPEISVDLYFKSSRYENSRNLRTGGELEIAISFPSAMNPTNLNAINILVSKDGLSQKVNFENSKWKATADLGKRCCGQMMFIFEIVIDLTYSSTVLMKKESKQVINHLRNLWNSKTLADITFKFKDKIIQAHTLIVASGSPVLDAMFKHDFKEKKERTVVITDIQSNVFDHLLRYIYTGDADMNSVNVAELLIAADKYGMNSLKEECALNLSQRLSVENATRNLILAHLHNSTILHQSTLDFMSKNAKAVCFRKDWKDLLSKYPELAFAAIQLMVKD